MKVLYYYHNIKKNRNSNIEHICLIREKLNFNLPKNVFHIKFYNNKNYTNSMIVQKKCTSISKKLIRNNLWKNLFGTIYGKRRDILLH